MLFRSQINMLITYQSTGLKLKLLYALFNGRHCMVNKEMVEGTGLEDNTQIISLNDKNELLKKTEEKMFLEFTENDLKEREIMLAPFFDNVSVQKLMKMLFETP